ncbi:penicillin-binding transpeptidase domain-containing protein [Muricomes intestini]|uniref:Penicillin-binding protein 2 n=1 Tax=Muricomes intestini TaxID=1796634 RepID=A0A4R3KI88_9FIRM|nr:penicillin-binding transpeptidase domain-containing protein [Muricomes intestini]TCS82879.1 penicillin-binding protein 2 [Muricomes intestini]HAX51909.1 penicillin-binding protein [Lachnospiraceae bacterium]HCR84066.1 penicillin-binding protein [Lachnospiraceae bacterium]
MFERIKDAINRIVKSRLFVLVLVFCVLFAILINRVFYLQIVKGQYYLDNYKLQIRKTREIPGTRGNIYDRNGNLLAYNELAYSVTMEDNIPDGPQKNKILNDILDKVITIVESNGDSVINDFGIVLDSAGNYEFSQTNETLRLRFVADVYGLKTIEELDEQQKNASAEDIINYLCTDKTYGYGLNVKKSDKPYILKMVNLRYAINLNSFQKFIPTILATDVSDETVAAIMENLDKLEGVDVAEDSMRRYTDSKFFASIIGYTGKISQEEYDDLDKDKKKQYTKTDIIGKAGLEKTMDEVLQGKKGETELYVDSVGKVTETVSNKEPEAGNDVHLTIDKDLQEQTYQLLEEKLAGIVLNKLRNVMNYDPSTTSDAKEIIIPVDDAYNAFIGNEIIDESHFGTDEAKPVEKQVYSIFTDKKAAAVKAIINEMNNSGAAAYKDLPDEMKAYMDYISINVLQNDTGILMKDAINTGDETYQQWTKDETISLHQYLNYAISQNWIDTSKLSDYVSAEKYSDSEEIYQGILTFLQDYLGSDINFDKLLYKYLIKSGGISGGQICAMVYEQGVLPMDEAAYNGLVSGAVDSYTWLYQKIQSLEITPGQLALEPCTGSAVVSDPNTGAVLACVSYPGYDNNRLSNTMDSKYYNQLVTGLSRPFYNNATQERTAPGSTYKMVSAVAGLTEGIIAGDTYINCAGEFDKVTPSPRCWIYPGYHGSLTVVNALEVSCNDFFYEVGYDLGTDSGGSYDSDKGVEALAKYAKDFGLGEKSGLEIPESEPQISDEYSVQSAIGQGTNNYTVSQLNRYVAAVANRGSVYNLTLLGKTTDVNGKLIKQYEPVVDHEMKDVSSNTWDLVHQGMEAVIGYNSTTFSGLEISMAGKTGTAQQSAVHPDHGLFVGYAPAEAPEIAIAVRIANGYSSSYAAEIGRDIVRANFKLADKNELITGAAAELGSAIAGD